MGILIDSTVYIDFLRRGIDPRHELASWAASGHLHSCGIVRAEVVRGCRDPQLKRDMEEFFDLLPEVPAEATLWREVTDLAWKLDREGKALPLSDLIIACCARQVPATVVSSDPHFDHVPELVVATEVPAL